MPCRDGRTRKEPIWRRKRAGKNGKPRGSRKEREGRAVPSPLRAMRLRAEAAKWWRCVRNAEPNPTWEVIGRGSPVGSAAGRLPKWSRKAKAEGEDSSLRSQKLEVESPASSTSSPALRLRLRCAPLRRTGGRRKRHSVSCQACCCQNSARAASLPRKILRSAFGILETRMG